VQAYFAKLAAKAKSKTILRDLSAFGGFYDSLVLDSIKRSAINIRRSMLDVRCSMFNLFTVPARWSFIRSFTRATPGLKIGQSDRERNSKKANNE
jgi:hypothetical protein